MLRCQVLRNGQGTLGKLLDFFVSFPVQAESGQIVQEDGDLLMLRHLFPNSQRPTIERFSFTEPTGGVVPSSQLVQAKGQATILGAKRLCLSDREQKDLLGFGVAPLLAELPALAKGLQPDRIFGKSDFR